MREEICNWVVLIAALIALGGCGWRIYHDLTAPPISSEVVVSWKDACEEVGSIMVDDGECAVPDKLTEFVPDLPERMFDGIIRDRGGPGCPVGLHPEGDGCELDSGPHSVPVANTAGEYAFHIVESSSMQLATFSPPSCTNLKPTDNHPLMTFNDLEGHEILNIDECTGRVTIVHPEHMTRQALKFWATVERTWGPICKGTL